MPLPLAKLPSVFVYVAVIVSAPAFSALVVIVAMSVLPIVVCIAAGSIVLSLEVNTTVPVGAAPEAVFSLWR